MKNEPAFPTDHVVNAPRATGLTKREYFAGLAMQAICQDRTSVYKVESIAKGAVEYADALMAELEKEK